MHLLTKEIPQHRFPFHESKTFIFFGISSPLLSSENTGEQAIGETLKVYVLFICEMIRCGFSDHFSFDVISRK